ncbi:hypothetical protein H072_3226 [Dactylellina haptotyla CBS 200.50]|uniref:EB1 C-terminal domain-containing protein n=1 Tax=Dactylellina haptotyla (strain CBS 200.50) TaxID=1284197 RepID=S8AIR6_DACHA|nr:hypothetical protein H072_3226 [Dactylellina haptotyla CBS 200.50]
MAESRQELLNWLNALLQLNMTKVEQCGTGAAFCQILDSIYLDLPMAKVKFNANAEWMYRDNFKVLTNAFIKHKIDKPVPVTDLVKCKMQDNLAFLQFMKRHWDSNYPGGEYDAVTRRKGQAVNPPISAPRTAGGPKTHRTAPQMTGSRTRTPLGGPSTTALQQEIETLRENVTGLERERDFYFSKLRDIELLVQESAEQEEESKDEIIKKVQSILYSTEDGFEIPDEEQGPDDETF